MTQHAFVLFAFNVDDVFRCEHDFSVCFFRGPEVEHGLKTVFDVYMPTSQFRKTSPGLPHHRICVMR